MAFPVFEGPGVPDIVLVQRQVRVVGAAALSMCHVTGNGRLG
jgi:hypothetical protein